MKILIIYYSETGNTEKIARAIHEIVAEKHESTVKKLAEVEVSELNSYDLVFLGSACHHANLAPPVLKWIKDVPDTPNFKLAGFVSHATYPPEERPEMFERWGSLCEKSFEKLRMEKHIEYFGYFRCMGVPSKPIEQFILSEIVTEKEEQGPYVEELAKHPTPTDLENAKEFARKILGLC